MLNECTLPETPSDTGLTLSLSKPDNLSITLERRLSDNNQRTTNLMWKILN